MYFFTLMRHDVAFNFIKLESKMVNDVLNFSTFNSWKSIKSRPLYPNRRKGFVNQYKSLKC